MWKETHRNNIQQNGHWLVFVDDVVVLGLVVKHVAEIVEDVITVASQIDLTINVSKSKYMINRKKKGNDPEEIEINGQRYENTEIFKCLFF